MRRPRSPIERLPGEVAKYESVLATYWKTDVRHDSGFQRRFNGFYQLRFGSKAWFEHFYRILEGLKKQERTFAEVLQELLECTGRVEASFASKAVATCHPEQPIIDRWVKEFLRKRAGLVVSPSQTAANRVKGWVSYYDQMGRWYRGFRSTPEGTEYIRWFDTICPGRGISDLKKLDFVIWVTKGDTSLLKT